MAFSRIKVANFKSFDELDLELRPLNVVVGANASGKSSFLEIFKFLHDLAEHGLADAVSLQGGMEFLYRRGGSGPLRIEATFDEARTHYALELQLQVAGYEVVRERLSTEYKNGGSAEFVREGSELRVQPDTEKQLLELMSSGDIRFGSKESFLDQVWRMPRSWKEIAAFDLDPKLPKRAVDVASSTSLAPDGSNLAVVLRNVLLDETKREDFLLLVKSVLPFVRDIRVDRFAERHLHFSVEELYSPLHLPASFLSDGTVQVIGLILALYFQRAEIVLIEEPERNLHPHLISEVVTAMQDAARARQVIVTTHSPEVVKHSDLENLLLVQRDEQGRSRILRPSQSQEVQIFLENDLGVEDLYVQNLLSFGHAV